MPRTRELPLLIETPREWGENALSNQIGLLCDHAHLERKAATNALDLIPRWPGKEPSARWINVLAAISRDEVQHFGQVIRLLEKRGGKLTRHHKSTYASRLRNLVRLGLANRELIDRLMVASLIEARSCERFKILAEVCEDAPLAKFYKALWASEHGHYKVYLSLAEEVLPKKDVQKRWKEFLEEEAKIIQSEEAGVGIHAWV